MLKRPFKNPYYLLTYEDLIEEAFGSWTRADNIEAATKIAANPTVTRVTTATYAG